MSIMNNLDEIVESCLYRLERGFTSIEECVTQYPECAELEDLLRAAQLLRELDQPLMPVLDKSAVRQQVLSHFKSHVKPMPQNRSSRRWWRWAIAAVLTVVLVTTSGTGLVHAAKAAVPGDILYGFKRTLEQTEVAFAAPAARAEVFNQIAYTRLAEVTTLSLRGQAISKAFIEDTLVSLDTALSLQPDPTTRQMLRAQALAVIEQARVHGTINNATAASLSTVVSSGDRNLQVNLLTSTPTATSTVLSFSNFPTKVNTNTPTASFTFTFTPTATTTYTATVMETPSLTPSDTATPEPTETDEPTFTPTPTFTLTPPSPTPTDGPSDTPTFDQTRRPTHPPHPTNIPPTNKGGGNGNGDGNGNGGGKKTPGKGK